MDNSDDEIQAMELIDGDYNLWLQWPSPPSYWERLNRPVIKIAAIR